MAEKKQFKMPSTLGACADRLMTVRDQRLAEAKKLEPLKTEESQLKDHIIDHLPKSQASGIAGKKCRVTITQKVVPSVKDWDKFYAYILKTKQFNLLGRTINSEAIEELWEAKKTVPGIETFKVIGVSINKV